MKRLGSVLLALVMASLAAPAGELKIYTEVSPPQQIQERDGSLSGIGVEVVRTLQKLVGNRDPIRVVPWPKGYQAALDEPDVVLFSMARTAERESLFHWIGPLDETIYYVWVKAGSRRVIRTPDDARGLKAIGVYRNDVRDQFLTRKGFTNLDRADDNLTNLEKLLAGDLDAFVATFDEAEDLARAAGCQLSDLRVTIPICKAQMYIVMSLKTREEVVKAWSSAFGALRDSQTFEGIFRSYKPSQPLPDRPALDN
jgi:polar amino acid transport system substrate-binding protein